MSIAYTRTRDSDFKQCKGISDLMNPRVWGCGYALETGWACVTTGLLRRGKQRDVTRLHRAIEAERSL